MKISYAIPVCNEDKELDRLLAQLLFHETPNMEVVVQCDQGNTTPEVYKVLDKYSAFIHVVQFPLKGNFAAFKNNLKKHNNICMVCTSRYLKEGMTFSQLSYKEQLLISIDHSVTSQPIRFNFMSFIFTIFLAVYVVNFRKLI